jgi:hypothetical protein
MNWINYQKIIEKNGILLKKFSLTTGTTFKVINQLIAENFFYHTFIVAMINVHVVLGFPMMQELLDKGRF